MDTFRNLPLPDETAGRLYLHSMPGRYETMAEFLDAAKRINLDEILCLCGMDEMQGKSPEYAKAVKDGSLPGFWKAFPISDYSVPSDESAFKTFIIETTNDLHSGKNLLLHCGAGVGRTGMTAACILMALGRSVDQANVTVLSAGSGAERPEQKAFIKRFNTEKAPDILQDRGLKCQEAL